ncbi:RDD family protein [Edaphocola aurantiacus]|uniref:RDD family protein n=1 Tax=Edaphocola aurantiacus TaxID=2601682 RepID=UPI001C96B3BE|nr:RDD family protein [Edaphocola aurantiacus]
MYTQSKVNTGTRIGSMLLDHFIMSAAAMILTLPAVFMNFFSAFNAAHPTPGFGISGPSFYLSLIGFALYLCKDVFQGRSPGKRITKLQIVHYKTGAIASPLRTVVRNLFCIIWPVEVIITLINPGRRLGDLVAGTRVVNYDPAQHPKSRTKLSQLLISLLLAYGFMLAIAMPFRTFMSNIGKAPYIEQSYNEQTSKALEAVFTDSLGDRMSTTVRIYDKTTGSNLKYIYIVHKLKQNELEDDERLQQLRAVTHTLLNTVYPDKTFTGQEMFLYKDNYSMKSIAQNIGNNSN